MADTSSPHQRPANTQVLRVSPERSKSSGDVVFIHGLDGDPFLTWSAGDRDDSWLQWLAEDFTELAFHTIDYAAWSSRWRGTAMPMQDRAINLIAALESAGIGTRPLVFVCHSMGGLLAKQIVFQSLALSEQSIELGANVRGVAFLATPHSGSSLSKVADALRVVYRPTAAIQDLEDNDAYLRLLNRWYRTYAPEHGIATLTLFETIRIKAVLVVDATSADPGIAGVDPIPTDCDHKNICKPSSRGDLVYQQVRRLIDRTLLQARSPMQDLQAKRAAGATPIAGLLRPIPGVETRLATLVQELQASGILDDAKSWLLRDQIPESGGWGVSQAALFEHLADKPVTDIERREGGIISTYVALRALRTYEADVEVFRSRRYAWRAARYLIERQTHEGSFGRFVESRSGEEIHPTLRHTAFAVAALLDLDPGAAAVSDGVAYLRRRLDIPGEGWWADEAAPSLALAGLLHLDDRLAALEAKDGVDSDTPGAILSSDERREIRGNLSRLSSADPHAPFWVPYARMDEMLFDTALTTIDLLPHPLEKSLRVPVARILGQVTDHVINGGVPYGPSGTGPDMGMSTLTLYILASRIADDEKMSSTIAKWNLMQYVGDLAEFIQHNWSNHEAWRLTYADTLAYLLRIPALSETH